MMTIYKTESLVDFILKGELGKMNWQKLLFN